MLVLRRKAAESVVVCGSSGFEHLFKVTVLAIRGSAVKLGFEIDDTVPVHRWEVWQRQIALKGIRDVQAGPAPPTSN